MTVLSSKSRKPWISLAAAAVLLLSLLAGFVLFPRAGRFIVAEDNFTHADLALILSGDPVHRALAARDLYRQGRIGKILVIPEPPDRFVGELVQLGLADPTLPPISERIMVTSGVPRSKVSFLPEPADGTILEAHRVRRFLNGQLPPRLVVITSKFASRRACFVFRQVLPKVEIFCYPTSYDLFDPDRWWSQPRTALIVVMEYQKFLANAVALTVGFQRD